MTTGQIITAYSDPCELDGKQIDGEGLPSLGQILAAVDGDLPAPQLPQANNVLPFPANKDAERMNKQKNTMHGEAEESAVKAGQVDPVAGRPQQPEPKEAASDDKASTSPAA